VDILSEKWFPGHMAKAKRTVKENLQNVDVVIEVRDARVPESTGNPDLPELLKGKPLVMALNKRDLADPKTTESWIRYFEDQGIPVTAINAFKGQGIKELIGLVKKATVESLRRLDSRGRRERPIRIMIVGIPNVGKSQLINTLSQRGAARTGDRPGVTRGKQWIHIDDRFMLLDTPGILWPQQRDPEIQLKLDLIAALDSKTGDPETIVLEFFALLKEKDIRPILSFFKLEERYYEPLHLLEEIGRVRGMLLPGGLIDREQTATHILRSFQTGKLGRISFEEPPLLSGPDGEAGERLHEEGNSHDH